MDVLIMPDNNQKPLLKKALAIVGYDAEDLAHIDSFEFTKAVVIFMGDAPHKVDFLTKISNVSFEEAEEQKIILKIDGMSLPFLHLKHLVLSKISTGRPTDAADIEELQNIAAHRNSPD